MVRRLSEVGLGIMSTHDLDLDCAAKAGGCSSFDHGVGVALFAEISRLSTSESLDGWSPLGCYILQSWLDFQSVWTL